MEFFEIILNQVFFVFNYVSKSFKLMEFQMNDL